MSVVELEAPDSNVPSTLEQVGERQSEAEVDMVTLDVSPGGTFPGKLQVEDYRYQGQALESMSLLDFVIQYEMNGMLQPVSNAVIPQKLSYMFQKQKIPFKIVHSC